MKFWRLDMDARKARAQARPTRRRFSAKTHGRHRIRAADLDPPPGVSDSLELGGPSPNPLTNLAIADIALRSSTFLARRAMERILLGKNYAPRKARAILKGRSVPQSVVHGLLARTAIRSVPGAILVGGSLAIRTLYDRSRSRRAAAQGKAKLAKIVAEGEES